MNGNGNESNTSRLTRRSLVRRTVGAGAALAIPSIVPSSAWGAQVPPSEKITLGVIGYGPRCEHVLGAFLGEPDVQCVAIADVQAARREKCKSVVDNQYGSKDTKMYRDFREMIARPDIDAVLIATGDRWHTPASVFSARAGKDIYCEKPCAMTIHECMLLAETIRRYGRVFQAGTQRRSIRNFQIARDLAVGGKLGKIKTLHASLVLPGVGFDWLPAEPEPPKEVVDWDLWVGPCPMRPYNRQYVAGGWRAHNDFNAGFNIMEWGAHTVDLCQWARGGDEAQPVSYEGDGLNINATYADGAVLVMEGLKDPFGNRSPQFQTRLGTCPVKYVGEEGWVETGDSGDIDAGPASLKADLQKLVIARRRAGTDAGSHVRNFLDCIKSRERSNSNADVTRRSHVAGHAAAISWFLKRKVSLDPATESFVSDDEANRLRARAYREPWAL